MLFYPIINLIRTGASFLLASFFSIKFNIFKRNKYYVYILTMKQGQNIHDNLENKNLVYSEFIPVIVVLFILSKTGKQLVENDILKISIS